MSTLERRLGELRLRFVERAARDRVKLQEALEGGDLEEVEQLCHRLAGLAGTFGFTAAGDAASALEAAVQEGAADAALVRQLFDQLDAVGQ